MIVMGSDLSLIDWRTRIAALYAAVRAEADPATGHAIWRRGRDELFRSHPQSPLAGLAADDPLRVGGLPVWDYDPAYRFEVEIEPAEPEDREVDTGADGSLTLRRAGLVRLPEPVGGSLEVWSLHQYGGGLFVPLKDATSGAGPDRGESYGGGRYLLDTAKGSWLGASETGEIVLDLNFAYHPSCRYDPRWQCPLAPPGNVVAARVEAGERLS